MRDFPFSYGTTAYLESLSGKKGGLCISIGRPSLVIVSKSWIPFGKRQQNTGLKAQKLWQNFTIWIESVSGLIVNVARLPTNIRVPPFFSRRSWLEGSTLILQRGALAVIKFMNSRYICHTTSKHLWFRVNLVTWNQFNLWADNFHHIKLYYTPVTIIGYPQLDSGGYKPPTNWDYPRVIMINHWILIVTTYIYIIHNC